jgi:Nucleotidyl transferase AbiEii toxin, Type IV TA system
MKAEVFLSLSPDERTEALQVASSKSGRPMHVLEKDVWVVWTLSALFEAPFGKHIVFKGGTSLSKVYNVINRFSEDIDVTYDIRQLADDLVKGAGEEPLPQTRSQAKKWSDMVRERLPKWLKEVVLPRLQQQLAAFKLEAAIRLEEDCIYIDYATQAQGYGYVAARVKIEFGARSTGEPAREQQVRCDAADFVPLAFPTAVPRVMDVERTAWEKMTAIHVFCQQRSIKDRLARHWYDIAKLDAAGHIDAAIQARDIAQRVVNHKAAFFAMKGSAGNLIDYAPAINGGLVLVPTGETLEALSVDYAKMIEDRLFLGDPEPFAWVVDRCRDVERRANAATASGG